VIELKNNEEFGIWKLYLFALKSPLIREKYQKRMEKFFDFLGLKGQTIEEKSFCFVNKSEIEGNQRVFNNILKFMLYQIERVNKKEIVGSTVQNYVKSINLFCFILFFKLKKYYRSFTLYNDHSLKIRNTIPART
jgi:hypothetical protein